jgi:Fic family protein
MDGNGRMGRFWQTLLLIKQYPVFEYLPIEHLIKKKQKLYYAKLAESDKKGHSTPFIEFMLGIINEALADIINAQNNSLTVEDRISLFKEHIGKNKFNRKDYLIFFKSISAPTASRDLKWGVEKALIIKKGNYNLTEYRFK